MAERASTEARPSLAAVLFTDLVGSTAQRAALGEERADELRKAHDRLLSDRIEAHAGQVVKGLGDGLMAAFDSASDALSAAVEAQQTICVYNRRPDAIAPLSVRMGLSVGDVSWDGVECFGTPVVEAARLVAVADGDQIICSDFVRVMARGRGHHRFRVLGPLTLKGLPEPVEACEVEWEPPDHLTAERLPFPRSLVVRSPTAFVGREGEVAEAERYLERADGVSLLWVVGEPGIGKTRLAAELARRAYDRGWDVLAGRCDEDLVVPFQPFLHALRGFVTATPRAVVAERLGDQPAELARLLPDVMTLVPGSASAPSFDPAGERYRLFEAVRSWLAVTAATSPLLLLVDDLHWADAATVQLLGHLARAADPAPLRIVGTLRDTEPESPELRHLLDDVGEGSKTIRLGGLPAAGVVRLVEAATGRSTAWDATGIARRVQEETGGNPLFVAAVLAGLDSGGELSDLPGDVTAAVRRRIGRLPGPTQELLRVGTVVGLEFDLRVVCRVLGLPVIDALEAVDAAVRGHLAEETGVNHYRFAHALVRAALNREIGPSRAAHYHGLVGEALEAVHGDRLDEHLDELAYHYGQAVAAGGPVERALRYGLAAAEQAKKRLAHSTAAERYQEVLHLLEVDRQGGSRHHTEVLLALGKAQSQAAAFEEARSALRRVIAAAEAAGDAELMARAAYHLERATTYPGEPADEAVDVLERAIRRLDPADSRLRVRVLTSLARALTHTGRVSEGLAPLEEAIAMGRRVGDAEALGWALWTVAQTAIDPEHHQLRLRSVREAAQLADAVGDRWAVINVAAVIFVTLLEAGESRDIESTLTWWQDLDRDTPWPWGGFFLRGADAMLALLRGRLSEAETKAAIARDGARGLTGIDPDGVYSLQMFGIRREQGRLNEVAPALRSLVRLGIGPQTWRPGLAALWAELGMVAEARAELETLVPTDEALVPNDSRRAISLSYLADAAAIVGDRPRAEVLYRELLPYSELCITCYLFACYGPATRYLGRLATTMGRFDDAQAHFEDALMRSDRLESPVWTAHTQYELARMLLTRRRPADAAQAELLARGAQETAARLGMRALQDRASRLLESGLEVTVQDD